MDFDPLAFHDQFSSLETQLQKKSVFQLCNSNRCDGCQAGGQMWISKRWTRDFSETGKQTVQGSAFMHGEIAQEQHSQNLNWT